MALKSNSKKAVENIKKYVIEGYNPYGYSAGTEEAEAKTFEQIARVILKETKRVKGCDMKRFKKYKWQDAFMDYAAGLPFSVADFYNGHGIRDLKKILEETDEEAEQYSECDAENMLAKLIFREISKVAFDVLT